MSSRYYKCQGDLEVSPPSSQEVGIAQKVICVLGQSPAHGEIVHQLNLQANSTHGITLNNSALQPHRVPCNQNSFVVIGTPYSTRGGTFQILKILERIDSVVLCIEAQNLQDNIELIKSVVDSLKLTFQKKNSESNLILLFTEWDTKDQSEHDSSYLTSQSQLIQTYSSLILQTCHVHLNESHFIFTNPSNESDLQFENKDQQVQRQFQNILSITDQAEPLIKTSAQNNHQTRSLLSTAFYLLLVFTLGLNFILDYWSNKGTQSLNQSVLLDLNRQHDESMRIQNEILSLHASNEQLAQIIQLQPSINNLSTTGTQDTKEFFETHFNPLNFSTYSIVTFDLYQQEQQYLMTWLPITSSNMTLLYRGTRDGFQAAKFHSRCDGQGATLILVKSEFGKSFGGYTSKNWTSTDYPGSWVRDEHAFLFSITHKTKHQQQPFEFTSIFQLIDYLPVFGRGHDFRIQENCDQQANCYSKPGNSYVLPEGFTAGSNRSNTYLAGNQKFKIIDIEVYRVQ